MSIFDVLISNNTSTTTFYTFILNTVDKIYMFVWYTCEPNDPLVMLEPHGQPTNSDRFSLRSSLCSILFFLSNFRLFSAIL